MQQIDLLRHLITAVLSREQIAASYRHVEGFLHDDEGYTLLLAAMHGPGTGAVVEIGSYMGRSTCFLAHGSKVAQRGPVHAIDTFRGSQEHQEGGAWASDTVIRTGTTLPKFKENLAAAGLLDHVVPIEASSEEAAKNWTLPIRLLFIDGDHSYEGVRRDLELFGRHVVPGGIVLFHDVGDPDWPGVTRAFREIDKNIWEHFLRVQHLGGAFKRMA